MSRSRLLEIHFLEDNPRGAYTLTDPTSVMTAYCMTRDTIKNAEKFEPQDKNGVYFLFGNNRIYTGKTEQGLTRIKQHAYHKDWWDRAIIFLASTRSFNSNIVSELERFSIEYLQENSPYELENRQGSGFAGARDYEKENVRDWFNEIIFDLEFLGIRMKKEDMVPRAEAVKNETAGNVITYEKLTDGRASGWKAVKKGLTATLTVGKNSLGEYVYIIGKDSHILYCDVPSNRTLDKQKKEMITDGRIIECEEKGRDGKKVGRLMSDFAASSPSGAYTFLYGGYGNGWKEWKNGEGESINTIRSDIEQKALR